MFSLVRLHWLSHHCTEFLDKSLHADLQLQFCLHFIITCKYTESLCNLEAEITQWLISLQQENQNYRVKLKWKKLSSFSVLRTLKAAKKKKKNILFYVNIPSASHHSNCPDSHIYIFSYSTIIVVPWWQVGQWDTQRKYCFHVLWGVFACIVCLLFLTRSGGWHHTSLQFYCDTHSPPQYQD